MATHAPRDADRDTVDLPPAVPSALSALTRLSWELGARIIDDGETTVHSEWTHTETPRRLSIYAATSNTVIIRVRTPVGRKRFYGATQSDLESALPELETEPQWRRRS